MAANKQAMPVSKRAKPAAGRLLQYRARSSRFALAPAHGVGFHFGIRLLR
jgi:hypothetical protein